MYEVRTRAIGQQAAMVSSSRSSSATCGAPMSS
jgi:hypothetical protein